MILELFPLGHASASVVAEFLHSMKYAVDNNLLENLWVTQLFSLRSADVTKKEGKVAVAQFVRSRLTKKTLTVEQCNCRILLVPIKEHQYLVLFGRGCFSSLYDNTVSHPQMLDGCELFLKDFEVAIDCYVDLLRKNGYAVNVIESN